MFGFDCWGDIRPSRASSAPVLHIATGTLVGRMATPPSPARVGLIDRVIRGLADRGIWAKLDALYVPAAHHAQAALLDWTGNHDAAVGGGAPVFVSDRGYHCNGSNDWIDLGFAPADGRAFMQNSACIAIWARNALPDQSSSVFGIVGSNVVGLSPRSAASAVVSRLNGSTVAAGGTVTTGYGLTAADRGGASSVQHYRDGAACGAAANAVSVARSSARFALGRGNASFAANQFCAVAIGGHLTADEHRALYEVLAAYMAAVGVAEIPLALTTRSMASAIVLPDGGSGAVTGKGWTCTGLARLPDGSWLVGNDGRGAAAGDPNLGSVVHLSADGGQILHQWSLASLGLPNASVQGIAWEPLPAPAQGRVWFVTVGTGGSVYRTDIAADWKAGAPVALPTVTAANGVAYDSVRDQIVVLASAISWHNKVTGAPTGMTVPLYGADADHLFHDPAADWLYYSAGSNGSPGTIVGLCLADAADYGAPAVRSVETMVGADAIEGIVLSGGQWWVANDAFFHGGSTALNRLISYGRETG